MCEWTRARVFTLARGRHYQLFLIYELDIFDIPTSVPDKGPLDESRGANAIHDFNRNAVNMY